MVAWGFSLSQIGLGINAGFDLLRMETLQPSLMLEN